jgi:hypothetical protein
VHDQARPDLVLAGSPRPGAEIHRISMAVPPPLHEVLEGKQESPLRCRLIVQVAESAELKVYPGRTARSRHMRISSTQI